jgi:hypothetical protein
MSIRHPAILPAVIGEDRYRPATVFLKEGKYLVIERVNGGKR